MEPERTFLGFDKPLVAAASDEIFRRAVFHDYECDLSHCTLVVPGARAGRRLMESLVRRSEETSRALVPPAIVTVRGLGEKLVVPPGTAAASDLLLELAWERVLGNNEPLEAQAFFDTPPIAAAVSRPYRAKILIELTKRLSAAGLSLNDVLASLLTSTQRAAPLAELLPAAQWRALAELETRYDALLHQLQLLDYHRLLATGVLQLPQNGKGHHFFLVCCPDLYPVFSRLLAESAASVSVLVGAPPAWAEAFTPFGQIIPDQLLASVPHLDKSLLVFAPDTPTMIANLVDWLRGLGQSAAIDECVIGVCSPEWVSPVSTGLRAAAVPHRSSEGRRAFDSPLVTALGALGNYLAKPDLAGMRALVRDPLIASYLKATSSVGEANESAGNFDLDDVCEALDLLHDRHFLSDLDQGSKIVNVAIADAVTAISQSIAELSSGFVRGERPVATWFKLLNDIIDRLLQCLPAPTIANENWLNTVGDDAVRITDLIYQCAVACRPEQLTTDFPRFLERIIAKAGDEARPPPRERAAVEVVGWLETLLDEQPHLAIVGVQEGDVPAKEHEHSFLPEAVQRALSLPCDQTRLARDVYYFAALQELHPPQSDRELKIFLAREGPDGMARLPSRIITRGPIVEAASTVLSFLRVGSPRSMAPPIPQVARRTFDTICASWQPPVEVRVSSLDTYLLCPFLFFLRHTLGGSVISDSAVELSPRLLGTFIHSLLARIDLRAIDESDLLASLEAQFATLYERQFGPSPPPIVQLQLRRLRKLLPTIARQLAEQRSDGWLTVAVEQPVSGHTVLLGGEFYSLPVSLTGRVDRIDYHPCEKRHRLIDIKSARSPQKVRLPKNSSAWRSLQLPAYRTLAHTLLLDQQVIAPELSYYLPLAAEAKNPNEKGNLFPPTCDTTAVAEGERLVLQTVTDIANRRFWPPRISAGEAQEWSDLYRLLQQSSALAAECAKIVADQSNRP